MFDFAYFVNSMYNGSTVAIDNSQARSPLGFRVHLQTRYVKLSTNISTGMYDLQDSSYQFFQRLDTTGYVIPSENEWVKAAYYSPRAAGNGTHYYYYPTVSNTPPTAALDGQSETDREQRRQCHPGEPGARRGLLQLQPVGQLAAAL